MFVCLVALQSTLLCNNSIIVRFAYTKIKLVVSLGRVSRHSVLLILWIKAEISSREISKIGIYRRLVAEPASFQERSLPAEENPNVPKHI